MMWNENNCSYRFHKSSTLYLLSVPRPALDCNESNNNSTKTTTNPVHLYTRHSVKLTFKLIIWFGLPYPYCHSNRPVPLLSPKQTRTPIVIQTDPLTSRFSLHNTESISRSYVHVGYKVCCVFHENYRWCL
jgi:hypothetical protein